MSNPIFTISLLLSVTFFLSCSSTPNKVEVDNTIAPSTTEKPSNNIFGINGEEIFIRTAPDDKSKKIVNQKATAAFGKPQYCELDFSTKVEVLETKVC